MHKSISLSQRVKSSDFGRTIKPYAAVQTGFKWWNVTCLLSVLQEYKACNLEACPEVRRNTPWTPWMPFNVSQGGSRQEQRFRYTCRALLPDPQQLQVGKKKAETRFCPSDGSGACQTDCEWCQYIFGVACFYFWIRPITSQIHLEFTLIHQLCKTCFVEVFVSGFKKCCWWLSCQSATINPMVYSKAAYAKQHWNIRGRFQSNPKLTLSEIKLKRNKRIVTPV